jgi:pyridoxamine 5'-phosphate oxidase
VTKDLLWKHGDQYDGALLDPRAVDPNPFAQFRQWFAAAASAGIPSVNACALATVSKDGWPAVRMVLLKEIDDRGLVFYTNYESAKARDLADVPRASMAFHWEPLHRQIRVTGTVEQVTAEELQTQIDALESTLAGAAPSRPSYWGGYRVLPIRFEFWQGQPSRLHDRVEYILEVDRWARQRLSP